MGEKLMSCGGESTILNNWPCNSESSLSFIQTHRVNLIDELADYIDFIVDRGLEEHLLSKDDYEDITYERGPRKKVRKLLDIIDCLGEENASFFCSVFIQIKSANLTKQNTKQSEYSKSIKKHKEVLSRRNDCIKYYNARLGEKFYFTDHFVNLLLVKGHYSLEIKKNELLTFGQQRIHLQNNKDLKLEIKLYQIFQKLNDRRTPKKILVSGVAGIGKTVFVQKILHDFAKTSTYSNFDFVLNLTFRDLNLINNPTTLREIIRKKHGHLSSTLDDIFNNSEKLLMILDGFDEFKFYNQIDLDQYVFDPDEEALVPQIFGSLLNSELLPDATIVVTSRPTVINHIPIESIDRFVVITGFSVSEIEDYFQKFYRDDVLGTKIFLSVKENHFLFTLCYIPAFCWIVCSVLRGYSSLSIGEPKTMTDIYCHYLVILLKYHAHQVDCVKDEAVLKAVFNLGEIAYHSFLRHETLFYEQDVDLVQKLPPEIVNSFLDKTSVQELEGTENVLSFTHFTIQEFFAAFYYAFHEVSLSDDVMKSPVQEKLNLYSGWLDLFHRFLSGLMSVRNENVLFKHLKLEGSKRLDTYTSWLIESLIKHCENGYCILNLLHCLFEQQRSCLVQRIKPDVLRLNLSDNLLSPIDFHVLIYFLNLVNMDIDELDLTATHVNADYLKKLLPYLHRCRRFWIGENKLDSESIKVICSALTSSDCKMEQLGLGWTQLEDEDFLQIYKALCSNCSLQGLWVEGNNISYKAVEQFLDITLTNTTLQYAVLLGNKLQADELAALIVNPHKKVIVVHIDNDYGEEFWQGWWGWIFQRCKMCSDEKIVAFLTKVYRGLGLCHGKSTTWMDNWYTQIDQFLQERIKNCPVNNIRKKIETLKQMFHEQSAKQ
ncbi:NACHT, LRR and PYD domains-containing 3-like [Pelobates cultripes]|uniref:NACHT, LRR and PYD domains-containing 3-like n=1 Tax=Pelobates cultripes TaxID=61616 RepID=A0AAD1SIK4_PELCU|nr:NACHT, LRR and PYD domains-containing 3-like [Pelobates cultripes]